MKFFNKNSDYKKYIIRTIRVVSLLLCMYLFLNILFFDTYSIAAYLSQKNRLERMKTSNAKLIEHNSQLEIEIEKLRNDSNYIESIARRNFTMVKPGETIFIFRQE